MKPGFFVTVLISAVFLGVTPPAIATGVLNKAEAKLAVVNIQKSIAKSTSDLQNLGENAIVGNSKIAIKYSQLLEPLTQKWQSDKKTAEDKISASLADLNRQSNFVVLWDNFVGCNIKQDKCIKDSVYNIPFDTKNEVNQSGFDRNILIGVIAPQDKLGYDKAREVYKAALQDLVKVGDAYQEADYVLRTKIFAEYESEEERLKATLNTQKLTLIAAKRASLASRDFETNFKTAFQFQYNLDSLYLVSSTSFSQIESYLDALNVVSSSQAYALGVGISRSYQSSKAVSFNKGLGNTFTNDSEFRSLYSRALSVYQSSGAASPKAPVGKNKASIISTPSFTLSIVNQVLTAAVLIPPRIMNTSENIIGIKGRIFQGDIPLLTKDSVQKLSGNEGRVNFTFDLSGLWKVINSRNLPLQFQAEYYGSSGSGKSILKEITLP